MIMKFSMLTILSLCLMNPLYSAAIIRSSASPNLHVEFKGRTICIYRMETAHIMEELSQIKTMLPIRSISVTGNKYLYALCRLGPITRRCMWNIEDPSAPRKYDVPQQS